MLTLYETTSNEFIYNSTTLSLMNMFYLDFKTSRIAFHEFINLRPNNIISSINICTSQPIKCEII